MSGRQRLFFALWPSPQQQALLVAWGERMQKTLGGRLTRSASVHLTLVFIGDVADSALDAVLRIGSAQRVQAFDLAIDRIGCWPHNGIAWAAPRATPPSLNALVSGLESRLRADGFDIETRPYRPHITLLRRARGEVFDEQPGALHWHADHFVLVRSRSSKSGTDYQRLEEWPLETSVNRHD